MLSVRRTFEVFSSLQISSQEMISFTAVITINKNYCKQVIRTYCCAERQMVKCYSFYSILLFNVDMFLSFLCILHTNFMLKSKTRDCYNKERSQHYIPDFMLLCTTMKMAYLTLEVAIISDLNNVLVIIVWSSTENGKTAHPQIPAGTSRSIKSLCWGRASPGTVLCLSSSCMNNMWPAFPLTAAQTTSQTSGVLLGTFQDHPLRSGMFFLPLQ